MADYQAPLRDMRFVLNEVFDAPALWASLPKIAENVDPDTADAILEEAGKITGGVLAPLNREADEQGCKWNEGEVTSPEGFRKPTRPSLMVAGTAWAATRNSAAWVCRKPWWPSLKK